MTWIYGLKSIIRRCLAIWRRELVRNHTMSALDRLDDRLLADIGVARGRIAEYAREVAHKAVPVPPMPSSGRKSVLARLRSLRERQIAVREISQLDDRLLRDIGIEPGRASEVIDAMPDILAHIGNRIRAPAARPTAPATSARAKSGVKTNADRTPDVLTSHERAANEARSPERRSRVSAEM